MPKWTTLANYSVSVENGEEQGRPIKTIVMLSPEASPLGPADIVRLPLTLEVAAELGKVLIGTAVEIARVLPVH